MLMKVFLIYVIIINIIAFAAMGYDKRKAKRHQWRVSENTLMLLALLMGAAGSFAGMYTFRHKTKHMKFVIGVPVCFLINVAVMYMICGFLM